MKNTFKFYVKKISFNFAFYLVSFDKFGSEDCRLLSSIIIEITDKNIENCTLPQIRKQSQIEMSNPSNNPELLYIYRGFQVGNYVHGNNKTLGDLVLF